MRVRSICILSILGLFGLVLAAQASHAQGMAPGQAAPPLPSLDLTKPGPRPSAVTQQAARPPAAAPAVPVAPKPTTTKAPPATAKAAPTRTRPGTAVKKTTKAAPKAAKGKPATKKPTTQTAARDR